MHFPQLFVLSTIANSIQQISPQKSKIKGKKKKQLGVSICGNVLFFAINHINQITQKYKNTILH